MRYVYNFSYTGNDGLWHDGPDFDTIDGARSEAIRIIKSGEAAKRPIQIFRDSGDSLDGTCVATVRPE